MCRKSEVGTRRKVRGVFTKGTQMITGFAEEQIPAPA